MAFSLENFDLHFPPELISLGAQLYEKNAVIHHEEVEKNLWSFEVKDRKKYEIEILITPQKVKSYSCECASYLKDQECKHVIAALYVLRIQKTKPIKPGVKVIRAVPKKLSVPNILKQIDPEELKNFVRNYSKRNKKFGTALKATFARKIEIENNEEKYETILNSIIRPATSVDHKISYQSIKQFVAIAAQFDAQFEDSISLKQYTEAFYIIKSLLSKISYVNHWTASENEEILGLVKHFHKQIRLLLEVPIAPSLRQEILNFSLELSGRSYYHITDSEQNLLLIALNPPGLKGRKDSLVDILSNKIGSDLLHEGEEEKIWIIRQYFIEKGLKVPSIKTPPLSSQAVYRIVDRLLEFKAYQGLRDFIEMFKVNGHIKDIYLTKSYVEVLRQIGSKEEILEIAHHSLLFFKDVYFYELFKKYFPESSQQFFESIQSTILKKRQYDYQKLYLDILESDQRVSELIDYLPSSSHALKHIYERAFFIKSQSNRLSEVLINLSDRYLSQYLGIESSNEMKRLLLFLRKNGWQKEMNQLQKHLLKDYDDRKSLQIEIQDV